MFSLIRTGMMIKNAIDKYEERKAWEMERVDGPVDSTIKTEITLDDYENIINR